MRRMVLALFLAGCALAGCAPVSPAEVLGSARSADSIDGGTDAAAGPPADSGATATSDIRFLTGSGWQLPLVRVETSEPPEGFQGACLAQSMTYQAQLPSICYRPANVTYRTAGTTRASLPAQNALVYSTPTMRVYANLVTCTPHEPAGWYCLNGGDSQSSVVPDPTLLTNGTCPCITRPVGKNSCCDLGMPLSEFSDDPGWVEALASFQ